MSKLKKKLIGMEFNWIRYFTYLQVCQNIIMCPTPKHVPVPLRIWYICTCTEHVYLSFHTILQAKNKHFFLHVPIFLKTLWDLLRLRVRKSRGHPGVFFHFRSALPPQTRVQTCKGRGQIVLTANWTWGRSSYLTTVRNLTRNWTQADNAIACDKERGFV